MDTQFFTSQIASLNADQSAVQGDIGDAQRKLALGEDPSAQSELANAQLKLAQIRGDIAAAQRDLNATECKEAEQKFKDEQVEERKRVDEEAKAKEKEEEDLKFLESVDHAVKDKPVEGLTATSIGKATTDAAATNPNATAKTEEKAEIKDTKSSAGTNT